METHCTIEQLSFEGIGRHSRHSVVSAFDGGRLTSDSGVLLLHEADRLFDVTGRPADAKYPPQGVRSCLGILNLEKSYGAVRLDRACGRTLSYGLCSYRRIQNMLKLGGLGGGAEQQPLSFPSHDNVRGSHYYN